MKVLYERGLSTLPAAELSSKVVRRHQERYQWPLALALLCLMAETFFPERRRFFKAGGVVRPAIPAIGRLALFFLVLGSAVPGWSASPKTAASHFERADYQAAQNEYERLLEESPDDPRLHYNAGVSAYRAGAFPESAAHFQSATISRDLRLQQRAYYNLGNSFFRIGEQQSDPAEKTQSWEQSIGDYEAALKLDPQDSDAHFNLDLVRKKLEELKQQQQQQQSQPNQDQDEKNQDQSDSPENENQPPQDEQPQQSEDSEQQPQQQPEQSESNPEEQPNSTPKDESGNDESPASPQPGEQEPEKPDSSAQKSAAAQLGQMTPEQARQLLDAQRQHEQPLIFVPPEAKSKSRPLKDW